MNEKDLIISTKAIKSIKSLTPIKKELGNISADKRSKLLAKMIRDDELFDKANLDLKTVLDEFDISKSSIDDQVFLNLADYLRKLQREDLLPSNPIAKEMTSKEQDAGYKHNFNNKESWISNVESEAIYKRGTTQSKETQEYSFRDKSFKSDGLGINDPFIRYADELQRTYFPNQPLITPELMAKIRMDIGDKHD